MTRDGRRQVGVGRIGVGTVTVVTLTPNSPTSDPPHQAQPRCPVYILPPSTRPDSCNRHRKVSNALPKPDKKSSNLGSYTSAVPDWMCPLLLGLAWACSLHFGFLAQRCVQPLNSWYAVVKISLTSKPSLFCLLTGEENWL